MSRKSYQPEVLATLKTAKEGLLVVGLQDVIDAPITSINNALVKLREKGLIRWTLDPGYKAGFRCRWYAAELAPRGASDKNPGDARTQQRQELKLRAAVAGKIRNAVLDPRQPADYSRAKVTVAPTPQDERFRLPEGARVVGGFATAGIGIDVTTGSPWGA